MIVSTNPAVVVVPRLGEWSTRWDAIVDQMPIPSPFLRSWWLEATAGADPSFVLVADGDRLLGGLAVQADRRLGVARLRHMGHGTLKPDHLDAVTRPEARAEVTGVLRVWFASRGPLIVELAGMVPGSVVRSAFPGHVRERVLGQAPWTSLPSTFDEYLADRPSTMRNSLRRAWRRLEKQGVVYRSVPRGEIESALDDLRRLHEMRFGSTSGLLPEFDAFSRAVTRGAESGEASVHELRFEGEAIASEVWFEVAGVASFYQSGRDPDQRWKGSGTVLKARIIEQMCERHVRIIDLLRDDEPYKRDWASGARDVVQLDASHGRSAQLASAAMPVVRALQSMWWRARARARRVGGRD